VEILNKHGIDAALLHRSPAFKISWFETTAPVRFYDDNFLFEDRDVLVIPEVMTSLMRLTSNLTLRRVAIALNWALIYRYLPPETDWRTYNIDQAIAGSHYEQEFIAKTMGIHAHILVSGTDTNVFHPSDVKDVQIVYMPRKNSMAPVILGAFRSMYPGFKDVPSVAIENLSHREVAHILGKSAIFIAGSFPEGMARPPLEAMACGCIVVGFAGRGSLEYMRSQQNCYLADDGDVLGAAECLAKALSDILDGNSIPMQQEALRTAAQYDLANEEARVLEYWKNHIVNASELLS